MEEIPVRVRGGEYLVHVGRGVYRSRLPELMRRLEPLKVAVLTQATVFELHGSRVMEVLEELRVGDGRPLVHLLPEGEEGKTLRTVEQGCRALLRGGLTRRDLVLALGGGLVGDEAGFIAATYMRGIPYVQLPTTLLAMVDASIGGKVGVDLPEGKNMVGTFHQPEAVLAEVETLSTLPRRELRCGLAEVAKYGFLFEDGILREMEGWPEGIPGEGYDMAPLVARCVACKAAVVERDERDLLGERALLNYGHTFGHALEAATGYRHLRHGEAVAAGMLMAARLSEMMGIAARELAPRHLRVLQPLLEEAEAPYGLTSGEVLERMRADKKREGAVRLVLLEDWQSPRLVEDPPLDAVGEAVDEILNDMGWDGRGKRHGR